MKKMVGYKCEICGNIFTEEDYHFEKTAESACKNCEKSHRKVESYKVTYQKTSPYPSFVDVTFNDSVSIRYSRDF